MNRLKLPLVLLSIFLGGSFSLHATDSDMLKIGLIGDSTVCDYPLQSSKRGWGQMFPEFFAPETKVFNHARGGLSSKSFPASSWQELLAKRPNYIFIQFGHNDMKQNDPARFTEPEGEYRENLRKFAEEARAVGAMPIFVTPVRRRIFKGSEPSRELKPYADAAKAEGAKLGVPVIDLYEVSGIRFAELGEEKSTAYTVNQTDQEDRPGQGDRSHFTEYGAREIAELVIEQLPKVEPQLAAKVSKKPVAESP